MHTVSSLWAVWKYTGSYLHTQNHSTTFDKCCVGDTAEVVKWLCCAFGLCVIDCFCLFLMSSPSVWNLLLKKKKVGRKKVTSSQFITGVWDWDPVKISAPHDECAAFKCTQHKCAICSIADVWREVLKRKKVEKNMLSEGPSLPCTSVSRSSEGLPNRLSVDINMETSGGDCASHDKVLSRSTRRRKEAGINPNNAYITY